MEIQATEFKDIPADAFGIVIRGCDLTTEENRQGFLNGVTNCLIEGNVVPAETKPEQLYEKVVQTATPKQFIFGQGEVGGRVDLVFIFKDKPDVPVNMGRFPIVRLTMPDCSWIEDWLVNDARHYNSEKRGPNARGHHVNDDDE